MQNISLEDLRKIFELKEHEPSLSQQNIADNIPLFKDQCKVVWDLRS